jgi:hypothetical protein
MTMRMLSGKREIFLDVVNRLSRRERLDLRVAESETDLMPPSGELSLVWQETPSEPVDLPEAIIGDKQSLEDLVAWASSYVRGTGPISANSRLLLRDEAGLLFQKQKHTNIHQCLTAVAGLVIAEVLALSDSIQSLSDISIPASLSTFAFVIARSDVLGHLPDGRERLADRWERVHRITNPTTAVGNAPLKAITETCGLVMDLVDDESHPSHSWGLIKGWFARLAEDGEVTPGLFSDVVRSFNQISSRTPLSSIFQLTPADRVRIFDDLAPALRSDRQRSPMERAFALATLASVCRPGTLQQFALLRSSAEGTTESLLWFGVIQGLHRSNDVLESGDGLGRRILRELLHRESVADRPRSDIALFELETLVRGSSLASFRTNSPSHISVEVAPGVYTVAKWRSRTVQKASDYQGELVLREERDPIEELDETLRYATNLLVDIRKKSRSVPKDETRKGKRWRR